MSADVQSPPQPRYSRYRSVRLAATNKPPSTANVVNDVEAPNDTIQRSRSRYHRPSRVAVPLDDNSPPNIPSIPEVLRQFTPGQSRSANNAPTSIDTEEQRLARAKAAAQEKKRQREELRVSMREAPKPRRGTDNGSDLNDQGQGTQEPSRYQQVEGRQAENGQLTEEEQVAKILAEQKRKDLQRLEMELAAATVGTSSSGRSSPMIEKAGVDKFGLFTRKRPMSKVPSPKLSGSERASEPNNERSSQEVSKIKSSDVPRNILQGGGGAVPGTDAPRSAVNAGERRVLIRCKQSSINLPIIPETTPIDLIFSAANILSHAVSPSASIMLESYTQLGLERRIRRYEHIRDIMNSWDRDTQNALIIQGSDSPNHDFDLEEASVPKEQPDDVTVYMYHSQKPGKWNKRFITLLSTGQIFISKKKDAKVTDKDITTICHLTDFDIYTPTAQQIRKNLRPPKKYCYAIKSQQKPAMFLDTEKFVHFFSSDDSKSAGQWYDACQQWRSWYLVNMMGEGRKQQDVKKQTVKVPGIRTPSGAKAAGHKIKLSVDENPYTIGSFKPLMDLTRFENGIPDPEEDEVDDRLRQVPFHLRNVSPVQEPPLRRERHPPPVSYPRRLHPASGNEPIDSTTNGSAFAPTSLLGRTYSQRQRAQKERDQLNDANQGPFIPGPSLLNSDPARPKTGIAGAQPGPLFHGRTPSNATRRPQTSAGTALQRNGTQKTVVRPLVDLTPKFVEPPQWSKEGKGHGVVPPTGVPLVEVATGPQVPELGVPVLFRRDG